jgi:ankyrin repeat protein
MKILVLASLLVISLVYAASVCIRRDCAAPIPPIILCPVPARLSFALASWGPSHAQAMQAQENDRQQLQLDEELLSAASEGNTLKVRELLHKGADPNAANTEGNTLTVLMLAANGGFAPMVKVLVEAGANVNVTASVAAGAARVNEDITPLMQAVASGDEESVRILLDQGADVNAKDKTTIIEDDGHEKEINRRPVLLYFTNNTVLRLLLERGADPNVTDTDGNTALMIAAERSDAQAVQALLAWKADVKARRKDGMTALSLAMRKGRQDIVALLRKSGADRAKKLRKKASSVPGRIPYVTAQSSVGHYAPPCPRISARNGWSA